MSQKDPNRDGSYINSSNWIKNKKATINHINEKVIKCFKNAVTVALIHEEIAKNLARIKILKLL